jgi:hypothetical protein
LEEDAVKALMFALVAALLAAPALAAEPPNVLDPANLAKPRPKPPFDLTGTWRMVRDPKTGGFEFMPMPKLTPAAQAVWDAKEKAVAEGKTYKDDTASCYPAGMPRFMTRVWPIQFIQLPTMVLVIQGLENKVRWIYTDGRPRTPAEDAVPSFNGESLGRWEGNELVVETTGFRAANHWMQQGVPVSEQLKVVERFRMLPGGNAFEVRFTFTDPVNWVGEWTNTKRYERTADEVTENECLLAEMMKLPSYNAVVR